MKVILANITMLFSLMVFGQCHPDQHSTSWNDAWYSCEKSPNPNPEREESHWIMYDLRHTYKLGEAKLWNVNAPNRLQEGMQSFIVDYSIDGERWETLGEYTLAMGPGHPLYEGEEKVNFANDTARYVLYTAVSNYGGSCTGLAETRIEIIDVVGEESGDGDGCLWLEIWPNPHSESFQMDAGSWCSGNLEYILADPSGRILQSGNLPKNAVSGHSINTSQLAAGIYHLILRQNNERIIRRVVKVSN